MHISPKLRSSVLARTAVLAVSVFSLAAVFNSAAKPAASVAHGQSGSLHQVRSGAGANAAGSNTAGSNTGRTGGYGGGYQDTHNDAGDEYTDEYDDCGYADDGYNDDGYNDEGYNDDGYGSYGDECDYEDDSTSADNPIDETPDATSGGSTLLHTFKIVGNVLDTNGASAADARAANAIWSRFAKLIPAERRALVRKFELRSRKYDGAYVYLDNASTNSWVLGVQMGLHDGYELDYTLVHEFGHLLTLNSGQIQASNSPRKCTTYYFGAEGCAKPDSISARFMAQFWSADMRRAADNGDNYLADYYPGYFVTDYAATDPAEDLAETFATFVMNAKPTGKRIADAKVNFFWGIPELVQLRGQIRANLV